MAWIEVHQSLINHRKTLKLRNLLYPDFVLDLSRDNHVTITCKQGIDNSDNHMTHDVKNMSRNATIGVLVSLWLWALDNAPSGDLTKISAPELSEVVGWYEDPQQLLTALIDSGFLDKKRGKLYIHDWAEYGGKLIKSRIKHNEYMRVLRAEKECKSRDSHVTSIQYSTVEKSIHKEDIDKSMSEKNPTPTKSSSKKSPWEIPADWQPLIALEGYKPGNYRATYEYCVKTCQSAGVAVGAVIASFAAYYPVGREDHGWRDPVRALKRTLDIQISKVAKGGNSNSNHHGLLPEDDPDSPQYNPTAKYARAAAEDAKTHPERYPANGGLLTR